MGDREFKEMSPIISCEPEIRHLDLTPATDRVLILACDGVFDVMTSQVGCWDLRRLGHHIGWDLLAGV